MKSTDLDRSQDSQRRHGLYPSSHLLVIVGRTALAMSLMGLGALGLVYADFALQWQPVPEGAPLRTPLAYATAATFAGLGAGALIAPFRGLIAWAAGILFLLWALVLHAPRVVAAPSDIVPWLGLCEILAIAAGAFMLAGALVPGDALFRQSALVARYVFGACLPVFGLSHFAYIQFTADMIPAWIPFHIFWAWFTGIGHVASGLSILAGILDRLGSLLFAAMVSGFVLLLHVPRTIADPASRQEWTMLVMASLIAAAAWCAAANIAARKQ